MDGGRVHFVERSTQENAKIGINPRPDMNVHQQFHSTNQDKRKSGVQTGT